MSNNLLMFAATAWIAFWLGFLTHQRRAKKRTAKPDSEASTEPARLWHPMPCATRLELGDTGYWIELVGKPRQHTYQAYDPEGDVISKGGNLKKMKELLEEQARNRTNTGRGGHGAACW